MTCPLRDDVYRFPWPGMTDDERRSLRAHADACDDCRAAATRLGAASTLLAEDRQALAPARRVALWTAIEAETQGSRWFWPTLALATTAAVALFVVVRAPDHDTFRVTRGELAEPAPPLAGPALSTAASEVLVERGGARLVFAPRTSFALAPRDLVRVETGRVDLTLDGPTPFHVETPFARIAMLSDGVEASVEVASERARVDVRRGRVRVTPRDAAPVDVVAPDAWSSAPSPATRERHRAELERARAMIVDDAAGARRLAQDVLDRNAEGHEAVDALALIADAHRRRGEHRRAAEYYQRVAAHPSGRGYAEEALLRRAQMLREDGDDPGALAALDEAAARFAAGPLAPERVALTATILIALDRVDEAAHRLEGVDDSPAVRAARRRLKDVREMKSATGSGYP